MANWFNYVKWLSNQDKNKPPKRRSDYRFTIYKRLHNAIMMIRINNRGNDRDGNDSKGDNRIP